jgi:hypothetical protein
MQVWTDPLLGAITWSVIFVIVKLVRLSLNDQVTSFRFSASIGWHVIT